MIKRFKNRFCELIPTPARWMLLLLWFLCAVIALLVGPESRGAEKLADGHPDIQIVPENRVANQKTGVCWWACAEMIGNQFDIPQLKGLTTAVIASGIGVHEGASDEALAWWHAKLGIQPDKNPNGKTQDGVAWMRSKLEAGQPVIAGIDMRDRQGQIVKHVWLVTHMSYHPRTWSDGTKDHSIKFIDCNDITKVVEYPWQRFWAAFTGDAWSYDVTPVVGANPLRQGRQMLATGKFELVPKLVGKPDDFRKSTQTPQNAQIGGRPGNAQLPNGNGQIPQNSQVVTPTRVAVPGVAITPPGGHPLVTGKVPSNQDIKDGVQRPSDTSNNNAFDEYYFNGHDYYREFRERLERGKIRIPDR